MSPVPEVGDGEYPAASVDAADCAGDVMPRTSRDPDTRQADRLREQVIGDVMRCPNRRDTWWGSGPARAWIAYGPETTSIHWDDLDVGWTKIHRRTGEIEWRTDG